MTTEVTQGSTATTTTSTSGAASSSGASSSGQAAAASPASTSGASGQAAGAVSGAGAAAPAVDPTTGAVIPPAYTPNFKFKVMDKEHEIPEYLRGVVKDADTEKQLRELHEKAFGLDVVKPKYQSTKQQFEALTQEKQSQDRSIAILGKFIENNDFDSFFKALKISEEQVLQYALKRVEYRNLPPEQRMQYDAQMNERQRLTHLELENQQLQEQWMSGSVQARTYQLDTALAQPEIKALTEAFDAKVGKPGSFRAEVIKRGKYAHAVMGIDIPVEQAMSEVMQLFGPLLQSAASAPGAAAPAGQVAAGTPPAAPPVIPNVAGRATSPAKRVAKSVEDLREMANAL